MAVGLNPSATVEFSFLLGAGTIFSATAYKFIGFNFTAMQQIQFHHLLIGMAAAFVISMPGINFLRAWLTRNSLIPFAHYRIILGSSVILAAFFH
jgi:undecaprenyl-diphosphatase